MATYDEDPIYNPTPLRRRTPAIPGATDDLVPETGAARGGFAPDPLAGVDERILAPENYAQPLSLTRSMRYGPGDERDLSVPPPEPVNAADARGTWGAGRTRTIQAPPELGGPITRTEWRSSNGGYASIAGAPPPPPAIPAESRPLFSGVQGQSLADTLASGRRWQAEQDKLGLTTADMDYIRSYGRRAFDERNARFSAPATRADYLARQAGNLAVSVAERRAAQRELDALDAEQRRQDAIAADAARMATQLRMAETAAAPAVVSLGGGAGAVRQADGSYAYLGAPAPSPAAPAPVSFGGGAGAVPEIGEDGKPTGRYIYQGPPQPESTGDWVPGGGASSVNKKTGEVKTAPGANAPAAQNGRYSYKDGRVLDTQTGETTDLPPRERKLVVQEMIDRMRQEATKAPPYLQAAFQTQIEAYEAELRALSGEPDPTPEEAQETKKKSWWARLWGSDEPEQKPAATAKPAAHAKPAAPANPEAASSPTGHRRWTPGA